MATKGTIVPGILSSRSRTPLPKLMQSSTGRFMPSVTGSPFDDELLLRSAFVSFSVTSDNPPLPRRSPIDPTCLRLKTPLLPPRLSCVYSRVPSHSILQRLRPSSFFPLSTFLLPPRPRQEKYPEIFFASPSFLSVFPTAFRLRYRSISASLYSARAIVLPETIKSVVYG